MKKLFALFSLAVVIMTFSPVSFADTKKPAPVEPAPAPTGPDTTNVPPDQCLLFYPPIYCPATPQK